MGGTVAEALALEAFRIARLLVALTVLPFVVYISRDVRVPNVIMWYILSLIAVCASYFFSVIEGFAAAELMDLMQHVSLASAGALAFVAAVATRRQVRVEGDAS